MGIIGTIPKQQGDDFFLPDEPTVMPSTGNTSSPTSIGPSDAPTEPPTESTYYYESYYKDDYYNYYGYYAIEGDDFFLPDEPTVMPSTWYCNFKVSRNL